MGAKLCQKIYNFKEILLVLKGVIKFILRLGGGLWSSNLASLIKAFFISFHNKSLYSIGLILYWIKKQHYYDKLLLLYLRIV